MSITIPRSFNPFAKPQSGIAIRIAGPVLGSLAGAAASWALYSLVRSGPPKLSDLGSQLRGLMPRARRAMPEIAKQVVAPNAPEQHQKVSPPKVNPDPVSALQPNGENSHPGPDWTHTVLEAMKKEPRDYGYARMEWNAPLLSQYLETHHGQSIPSHRIRDALKESGYEWRATRYRKAHH